jgi:hypothetical protein
MEILFVWILMALICGLVGSSKGGSFFLFLLGGLILWPLVLVVAILRKDTRLPEAVPVRLIHSSSLPVAAPERAWQIETLPVKDEFLADGIIANRPYRLNADHTVTIMMQGAPVRFRSLEAARDALEQ